MEMFFWGGISWNSSQKLWEKKRLRVMMFCQKKAEKKKNEKKQYGVRLYHMCHISSNTP